MNNKYKHGDIVSMTTEFLGEPVGTLAYVYEEYAIGKEPGISIITENGVDIGEYSVHEQEKYLSFIEHTHYYYDFHSVGLLDREFDKYIRPLFQTINA